MIRIAFFLMLLSLCCLSYAEGRRRGILGDNKEREPSFYNLVIRTQILANDGIVWQSFSNVVILEEEPLTFRIRSGNGVLFCVLRLSRDSSKGYHLGYSIEAALRGRSEPFYVKSEGRLTVFLGREAGIAPWESTSFKNSGCSSRSKDCNRPKNRQKPLAIKLGFLLTNPK